MNTPQPPAKVHLSIGHDRSLCGLAPKNGPYRIVSQYNLFTASETNQCGKCIEALKRRGYTLPQKPSAARHQPAR
ncbi:MAG: hypothetical protein V4443_12225 [Pseudomonadota bacterium]